MRKIDPLAYIESAFLDSDRSLESSPNLKPGGELSLPNLGDYLTGNVPREKRARYRKTSMRAPRPRRRAGSSSSLDPGLREAVEKLPASIAFLLAEYDDAITARSYGGEFKETRRELVRRLLDPVLTLEETSRLLGVCPATIRRYTNRGWLHHERTSGGQRRFRLSHIVSFVEEHGRTPESGECKELEGLSETKEKRPRTGTKSKAPSSDKSKRG